jgi:hypothetical protein
MEGRKGERGEETYKERNKAVVGVASLSTLLQCTAVP